MINIKIIIGNKDKYEVTIDSGIAYVKLKKTTIMIDAEDLDKIKDYSWRVDKFGFVVSSSSINGIRGKRLCSYLINSNGKMIYYLDGDKLNNTKRNLTLCKNEIKFYNDYGTIKIKEDIYGLFSLQDKDLVLSYSWHEDAGYVKTTNGMTLHRTVLNAKENEMIDHINMNKLDNRRENLRICNHSQNHANKNKTSKNGVTSRYKGVVKLNDGIWQAKFREKIIGKYKNEIAAANIYNHNAKLYYGEFARLNDVPYMCKEEIEQYRYFPVKGVSSYIGVTYTKQNSQWRAYVTIDGKPKYIGSYKREIDAAKGYNDYVIKEKLNRRLNDI